MRESWSRPEFFGIRLPASIERRGSQHAVVGVESGKQLGGDVCELVNFFRLEGIDYKPADFGDMPRRGGDNFVPTGISESNFGGAAVAFARNAGDELAAF